MRNKFRLSSVSLSLSLIIDISLKLPIDIYLFSYKKLSFFFFFFFEKRNVHVSNRESSILEEFLKRRNGWFEPYSTINNETKRVGFYRLRGKWGNFSSRDQIPHSFPFIEGTGLPAKFSWNGVSHAPSFPLAGLFHTRASSESIDRASSCGPRKWSTFVNYRCSSVDGSGVCTRQQCGAGAAAACDYRDFTSGSRGSRRDKSSSTRFVELAFSAFSNRCSVIY